MFHFGSVGASAFSGHYGSFHVEYVEDISYHDLSSWSETDAIDIA